MIDPPKTPIAPQLRHPVKSCPLRPLVRWLPSILVAVALLGVFVIWRASPQQASAADDLITPGAVPATVVYFPLIANKALFSTLQITDTWTSVPAGGIQDVFLLGQSVQYNAVGENYLDETIPADLRWVAEGPCGITDVVTDTLILEPGGWRTQHTTSAPTCAGVYTATLYLTSALYTDTQATTFAVHFPSAVEARNTQGFDRCLLPTVEQMQTWWDSSPYTIFNLYIGGIHFACRENDLNPQWIQAVSGQGWDFILTWVGPQAPCSNFLYKIDYDPLVALQQGRAEADDAVAAAFDLGISGDAVIYYDMEAYSGSDVACGEAVLAFLEGWTTRLHELGVSAGGYGSACGSNMAEWWANSPRLDNIWMAHWYLTTYDPEASVWGTPCISDSAWPNNQRIKQYTGSHSETWGGVSLTIDSDVLDGEITAITGTQSVLRAAPLAEVTHLRDMGVLGPLRGWVLVGDQVLRTADGGSRWEAVSPAGDGIQVLDVVFQSWDSGWLLVKEADPSLGGSLALYRTATGGQEWDVSHLPLSPEGVATGFLTFLDDGQTGWVVLKLESGSSFSRGRLFATSDGGRSWEERAAPLGAPARFIDSQRGWMAGGPDGSQLYFTEDGGYTWRAQTLPDLPAEGVFIDLPITEGSARLRLPVTLWGASPSQFRIYLSRDGGRSWVGERVIPLKGGRSPGGPLPFASVSSQWWVGVPGSPALVASSWGATSRSLPTAGQGAEIVRLEFISEQAGWVLVQAGFCTGDKLKTEGPPTPLVCSSGVSLWRTQDGGRTWDAVPLPILSEARRSQ